MVPLDDIHVDERQNYMEKPIMVLDEKTKTLCNKVVDLIKVQWQHRKGSDLTWEPNEEMREHYPELFVAADFEDEV